MLRSVLKQIVNRRKSNTWIALELLLVFCFLWYMVDYFFVLGYNYSIPSYRNTDQTYLVKIGTLPENHPDYQAAACDSVAQVDNFYRVISRIRQYPAVEAVGLSYNKSFPGSGSYYGTVYRSLEDTTKEASVQELRVAPEEDYFKVFRHTVDKGRTPVTQSDFDWSDPHAIVISRMIEESLFPESSAVGKQIMNDEQTIYHVKGVVDDVKRFDHSRPFGIVFTSQRIDASTIGDVDISIRIKKDLAPADFIHRFRQDLSGELRIGNAYLKNISSFNKIAQDVNFSFGITGAIRARVALMLFFLLNILLCVIGTFWYRVNVRREEIGIRRTMGASSWGVVRLLLLEGLCLLTLVTLPAMVIELQFVYAGLIDTLGQQRQSVGDYLPDHTAVRLLITNLLTWLLMACIILIGVWSPARTAVLMSPADALRDE